MQYKLPHHSVLGVAVMQTDITGSTGNPLLNNRNNINETQTRLFNINNVRDNVSAINLTDNPPSRWAWVEFGELPEMPGHAATVAILILSAIAFLCSCFVLTATYFISGGVSATLVYLQSLCLSDALMSTYGISKMIMLLFINSLHVNFFLPESIFMTSSLTSVISLLSLIIDRFLKLARPNKYTQVDKDTVISIMLLIWNMAFVIGFLPLVGWNKKDYTARFFNFFPWPYLLLIGSLISACFIACIAVMFLLKKVFNLLKASGSGHSIERSFELQNHHHIQYTIVADLVMFLMCYLPFFMYIGLICPQCLISDYAQRDTTILYFIPVFIIKSLLSSALQAFRTLKIHLIMSEIISNKNRFQQKHVEQDGFSNGDLIVSMAFINPQFMLDRTGQHSQITLHHTSNDTDITDIAQTCAMSTSRAGTTNLAYQPSLEHLQTISNFTMVTTSL